MAAKEFIKKYLLRAIPEIIQTMVIHDWKAKHGMQFGHYHLTYSQQGEDGHLARYFENRTEGYYVDIGAYHPFQYSNSYLFYKLGWRGLLIEPNPDQMSAFKHFRPKDIFVNEGVGHQEEALTYHRFNTPAINTFSKSHAEKWIDQKGHHYLGAQTIHVRPLKDILQTYLQPGRAIDFMSVDCEALDLEVLKSNDWTLYRPEMVIVESDIDPEIPINQLPVSKLLIENAYSFWAASGGSLLFKRNDG